MGKLVSKMPLRQVEIDPSQGELDITVERQIDEDGIGMGVLSDGTPFLNQRGLARLCGVKNKYIGLISSGWNDPQPSRAVQQVRSLLAEQGSIPTEAVHETFFGRVRVLAYPDSVCTAILEYYAFEANLLGQPIALDSYRRLAGTGWADTSTLKRDTMLNQSMMFGRYSRIESALPTTQCRKAISGFSRSFQVSLSPLA